MIPMSIPTFGGMLIQSMTMFIVPILQCWWREGALRKKRNNKQKRQIMKPYKLIGVLLVVLGLMVPTLLWRKRPIHSTITWK